MKKRMTNWQIGGSDAPEIRAFIRAHNIRSISVGKEYRGCNADIIGTDQDGDFATTSPITGIARYSNDEEKIHIYTASGSEYILRDEDAMTGQYGIEVGYLMLIPNNQVNENGKFDRAKLNDDKAFRDMQRQIRTKIIEACSYGEHSRIDLPVNTWAIAYQCSQKPTGLPGWLSVCKTVGLNTKVIRGITAIERLTSNTICVYIGDNIYFYGHGDNCYDLKNCTSSPVYHDQYETVRAEVRR